MKTCVIYTVKNDPRHLNSLKKSLRLVKANLNPYANTPDIILFNDPGTADAINVITKQLDLPNTIKISPFKIEKPSYRPEIERRIPNVTGYKHMCRFWAGEVFKRKLVREYDYYMRLDCDSYLTRPIGYDPFQKLEDEGMIYGYISGGKFKDNKKFSVGLNDEFRRFEKSFSGPTTDTVDTLEEGLLYYTNFEVCKVKAFSESSYLDFYDHVDKSGGIYIYRWGDHTVRYAGIHLLLGNDRVKAFTDIAYTHQTFIDGKMR